MRTLVIIGAVLAGLTALVPAAEAQGPMYHGEHYGTHRAPYHTPHHPAHDRANHHMNVH